MFVFCICISIELERLTNLTCSVGVYRGGRVEIIPNDQGNRITPSYVAFTPEGERLIGDAAKNQLTTNPENTVFDVKRLVGRTWDDASVQRDIQFYPFKVIQKNSKPHIVVRNDFWILSRFVTCSDFWFLIFILELISLGIR